MGDLAASEVRGGIKIAIDRGGTFCDVIAIVPGRDDIVLKLLSVDPENYDDAPTEGIRRVLEIVEGRKIPRGEKIDLSRVSSVRMGTTIATNALLERKGERTALLTTKGFKDLLRIGNQARPDIFDLSCAKPEVLYEKVIEVNERVTLEGYAEDPEKVKVDPETSDDLTKGITGETVRIIKALDKNEVRQSLEELWAEGFRSIAIVLAHSFTYPQHEAIITEMAESMRFSTSTSSTLMPMIKMVPRGTSATADAYLSPKIKGYLTAFGQSFKGGLSQSRTTFEFMQSDGGMVNFDRFSGLKAILSGPAGGVVGYAQTSYDAQEKPCIGYDMGGTSTDVSRYAGMYEHVFETTTAGVTIQSPQLDINTVAAGGGSMLFYRNGMFVVGPESASAHPGPACYRKGGPLTVTDANLLLGRLLPEYFPKIFGPTEDQPLDVDVTRSKFEALTADINAEKEGDALSVEAVAEGFLKVANEAMSRPIRTLTEARGFYCGNHYLASFGGAGGQHACSIANLLKIKRIIIHKYSSILSAYGMALADVVTEVQEPTANEWNDDTKAGLVRDLEHLVERAKRELLSQGFNKDRLREEVYLHMRYQGSDSALMVLKPENDWDYGKAFVRRHQEEFGFTMQRPILVDDLRVRGIARGLDRSNNTPFNELRTLKTRVVATSERTSRVYFNSTGWIDAPVYQLPDLQPGDQVQGPGIIIDQTQTIVLQPETICTTTSKHCVIDVQNVPSMDLDDKTVDPIQLSVFGHRFMAIAEQMGRTLQLTSVSTNIKERLDFSCAIFSEDGALISNAPHVPIHLGSMGAAVHYAHDFWKDNFKPGDVVCSNHPLAGGTHLPDITVITPVFDEAGKRIVFYVASRGHHADIGGITAGSMPPHSKQLFQEGAAIKSMKLVSQGQFDEEAVTKALLEDPAQYDGCSGTRCLTDNLSDLKAQVAANNKGITLMNGLIQEFGLSVVQFYMREIQNNAELSVRNLLRQVCKTSGTTLQAVDHLDDGSPISLKISINAEEGSAVFDFTGTGQEMYGNLNAPKAVTTSAILYCLRCLINVAIPLNQGCLVPINIVIPEDCLLSPSETAAVVGGNVLTSQRLVDVIFKAFEACAASQGCTNNLTFGTGGKQADGSHKFGFGVYETIAGGAGAGPTWHGQSGVHTHITNTRITDVEVFERRYPIVLHQFGLRTGSGGNGQHQGGEGVIREIEFRIPVQVSILSERRVFQPYGLNGGEPGAVGKNTWIQGNTGRHIYLGGKNSVAMEAGDRIRIETPGAGGWGKVGATATVANKEAQHPRASGSLAERHAAGQSST
ncbi:5-oxoprolinase [Protomyces lactucae-debilis]|uniref:5-oxoprolinase n=1 Tax=Protomyces lactucae-debilis TaxID=2754530 RepID=A0A1Y2FC77_PROLT|nr:5-oxoprolinase [Protomyces lactucae-debilis]ORY81529.1 5-oxoprolinase [Protomyces lactucae-debilis]